MSNSLKDQAPPAPQLDDLNKAALEEVQHTVSNKLTVLESQAETDVRPQLKGSEVIFVVEDDMAVRDAVRASLERYGYTVYTAADGDMALEVAKMFNARPDLLLTDVVMPHMTGDELVDQLKAAGLLPKVLMMSGYTAGIEGVRKKVAAGETAFIQKPFTGEDLATKVRELLGPPESAVERKP